MAYYRGCWLTVEIPPNRSLDENVILKALAKELPGIHLRFVTKTAVDQPTAAEAFVPETHAGHTINAETILKIASDVLRGFAIDRRKAS
jgi:hypothetical protein